jgi:hypothetical protein
MLMNLHDKAGASNTGSDPSPFQSAERALTHKALPGPPWLLPVFACVAVGALAYVVMLGPGETHALARASHQTEAAEIVADPPSAPHAVEAAPGSNPAGSAVPSSTATPAAAAPAPVAAADPSAREPAAAAADAPHVKPDGATNEALANAPVSAKKKARAARRSSHKRTAKAN